MFDVDFDLVLQRRVKPTFVPSVSSVIMVHVITVSTTLYIIMSPLCAHMVMSYGIRSWRKTLKCSASCYQKVKKEVY